MLILGEKYKFTNIELKKLNKKFDKVDIVKYASRPFAEVRLQIESLLKNHNYKFLIINTKEFIDPKMIKIPHAFVVSFQSQAAQKSNDRKIFRKILS